MRRETDRFHVERGDVLRPGRVGHVNGVVGLVRRIPDVVSQAVGCKRTLMAYGLNRRQRSAVRAGADGDRRQQLWGPAVPGKIVDVDVGAAAAVRAFVRRQQLAALVDLQRLPGIEHRGGLQITRQVRIVRIGKIDHAGSVGGRITRLRAQRGRLRTIIAASVQRLGFGPVAIVTRRLAPLLEFCRLPVAAVVAALGEQLQIAVESLEAGRAQCGGHLSLQSRLGIIVGTAHGPGNGTGRSGDIRIHALGCCGAARCGRNQDQ